MDSNGHGIAPECGPITTEGRIALAKLRVERAQRDMLRPGRRIDEEVGSLPGDPYSLPCPACSEEPQEGFGSDDHYVHLVGVVVNAGGRITTVDEAGTRIDAGAPSGRGVKATLEFECESGHVFTIDYQFHKGNTFCAVRGDPERRELGSIPTIWRD